MHGKRFSSIRATVIFFTYYLSHLVDTCQGAIVRVRGRLRSQFSLPAMLVPGNRTQGWQPLCHLTHPTPAAQRTVSALLGL